MPNAVAWGLARVAANGDERRIVVEGTDLIVYNTPELAEQRQLELGRFTSNRFKKPRVGTKPRRM